ncbi:MAG: hypothetical protein ACM3MK_00850 [Chitinophagales bacterium]
MSAEMLRALYSSTLGQVLSLEVRKKEVAGCILMLKGERERLPFIKKFLTADLDKHHLLEQVATAAFQNHVDDVIHHMLKLYNQTDQDLLMDSIRTEISKDEKLLSLVAKRIKHPDYCTFSERRLLQELNKTVSRQAREYIKASF